MAAFDRLPRWAQVLCDTCPLELHATTAQQYIDTYGPAARVHLEIAIRKAAAR